MHLAIILAIFSAISLVAANKTGKCSLGWIFKHLIWNLIFVLMEYYNLFQIFTMSNKWFVPFTRNLCMNRRIYRWILMISSSIFVRFSWFSITIGMSQRVYLAFPLFFLSLTEMSHFNYCQRIELFNFGFVSLSFNDHA